MPALLSLRDVSRTYHLRPRPWSAPRPLAALVEVQLDLHPRDVLAVLGESGSGKSTLARIAAGLESPEAGQVLYEGEATDGFTPAQRKLRRRFVQLVFQEPAAALDPRLTVRQCLEQPLRIQGLPVGDLVERRLEEVRLDRSVLDRSSSALSGGQKQRVGLARALALEPRVLILDEPLASLDASGGAHVLRLLDQLRRDRDIGLLWVTHDVRAARSFATRIAVLQAGRVVESGETEQVLGSPSHPHTEALVRAAGGP